jgi:hypothetical protein
MKHDWTTAEAWGKTGAVLLASTGLYAAFCVFCVLALPVRPDVGLAAGALVGVPLWIAAMCYAVLARTSLRAWLILTGLTLFFAGGTAVTVVFT